MKNNDKDYSRICLHTVTTKPWKLDIAIKKYLDNGIGGISVWRSYLHDFDMRVAANMLTESGLNVTSLVRGGFFTGFDEKTRLKSVEENKVMINEAKEINAGLLVLVCGSTPGQSLQVSRQQIRDGIEKILPHAEAVKVKLAIEPLHPVYSDSRSAINTLNQANNLVEDFQSPWLGIALDTYHVWWDPDLEKEIMRAGNNNNLFAVHLSDWRVPTRDILNDREIMGRGIINIQEIIDWAKSAGYRGMYEIEIFSDVYWSMDQDEFLSDILNSVDKYNF